jgi:hypothetical protein
MLKRVFPKEFVGKDSFCYLLLIVISLTMMVVANPVGEFPLNDDWAYSQSVKVLLDKKEYWPPGWTATNLFTHVVWGALFCLPFGFSFTAVRFSCLAAGLLGVLVVYKLLRKSNANPLMAFVGALTLAVNPLYFGLSNTFMSDVPAFCWVMLSCCFMLKGLEQPSVRPVLIGTFFACCAILSRQTSLVPLLAFGAAFLYKEGVRLKTLLISAGPAIVGVGTQVAYQQWLQWTDRVPKQYGNQIKWIVANVKAGFSNLEDFYQLVFNFVSGLALTTIYTGAFVFVFCLIAYRFDAKKRRLLWFIPFLAFVFIIKLIATGIHLMPLSHNVLTIKGLGPVILKHNGDLIYPRPFWMAVTAMGMLGAAYLLRATATSSLALFKRTEREGEGYKKVFFLTSIVIYFLPLGLLGIGSHGFYDRYVLPLLPLCMALVSLQGTLGAVPLRRVAPEVAGICIIGVLSVCAAHDYLSWNRTRWEALGYLMHEKHVPPTRIDGGFEFNGWYLYREDYQPPKEDSGKSQYWVDEDTYAVTLGVARGYRVVRRYPYNRWLSLDQGSVYILQKE